MVPSTEAAVLDEVFRALADGTRRDMLRRLTIGERTIGELATPYEMSFEAASQHVRVLERAGLVHRDVRGRNHYCQLDATRLAEAERWLSFYQRFWTDRFAALDRVLARKANSAAARPSSRRTSPITRGRR
jgi:DNA-binding transcriptional ArsR family regulator